MSTTDDKENDETKDPIDTAKPSHCDSEPIETALPSTISEVPIVATRVPVFTINKVPASLPYISLPRTEKIHI